jgi:hypothetical protein
MFQRIRRFFRSLFGNGESQPTAPTAAPASGAETSPAQPQGQSDPTPAAEPTFAPGTVLLHLKRLEKGSWDTTGELRLEDQVIAATLEGSEQSKDTPLLPPGHYPIMLANSGGKNSSYRFRFGEQHHGMLELTETPFMFPVHLCLGLEARHLYGSIILGERISTAPMAEGHRRVVNSENAYLSVYQRLLPHLKDQKPVVLVIEK